VNPPVLRTYQHDAVEAVFREWEKVPSTMVVMATGLGKTVVLCEAIRRIHPKRAIVIAHRSELIHQCKASLERIGLRVEVEMADSKADASMFYGDSTIVASVQSLISGRKESKRMTKFRPEDFALLVIDEFHHAVADSYRSVINHFRKNPNLKMLGVTATPDRLDEKALGQICDSVAFKYDIAEAIEDGFLVPIEQQMIKIKTLDYSHVRTTAGDLNGGDLAAVMEDEENLQGMVGASIQVIGSRSSIAFTSSVRHAEMCCDIFNRHRPGMAAWICGETSEDDRRRTLKAFKNGDIQVLANVGIACLDSETEILTRSGWAKCDNISINHLVANWRDGVIEFRTPIAIEVRDRRPSERMVFLETKNRSIRVTEDHRMVFTDRKGRDFGITTAGELVGFKCHLPLAGNCAPENTTLLQREKPITERQISLNSYSLRRKGMSKEDARSETIKRLTLRRSLRVLCPHELSLDHCRWIGFWCGDGTKSILQSGGIEYVVSGSDQWPKIAAWFESLSRSLGFSFRKRRKHSKKPNRNPVTTWSFCRGTGFGRQHRNGGIYCIEPYLDKSASDMLWCLTSEQFDAFLHGLWCADGDHYQGVTLPKSFRVYSSNWIFVNMIQAVAVCRGYRCNVQWKKNHDHKIATMSFVKRPLHSMTKFTLQFEEGWKPEKVWCVKVDTGLIVTRRRGTVTVTGNTEGFDAPNTEVIIQGRPTKSRALYTQTVGRGTRPLAGVIDGLTSAYERREAIALSAKRSCLVLDFVGNSGKHKLITTADILGGKYNEETVAMAVEEAQNSDGPVRMAEALAKADQKIRERIEQQKRSEAARKAHLVAKVQFVAQSVSPFDLFQIKPRQDSPWDRGKPLTENQKAVLRKMGVNPDEINYAAAKQLLFESFKRRERGLCTVAQARVLAKYGYDPKKVTFVEASRIIDGLKSSGWRRADQLLPT
jgi:superfamily II DNA or RNA helicase